MTELKTKSGEGVVKFCDVVSRVLRDGLLNDAVIDFGIRMIAESVDGCITFSSLTLVAGWPKPPRQWLSETSYVVMPINLSSNYWGVIIVEITFPTTLTVYFYEPLHDHCYRKELDNTWDYQLRPYLEKWHSQSGSKEPFPKQIIVKWIAKPSQPDLKCCGVMVLGILYAYLRNTHRFERHRVTEAYVSVIRLRLAWLLLCTTKMIPHSKKNLKEMQKTIQEISKVLLPQ
ncbi:hypothetical protein AM587_10001952 [Phytophthora nicotianae]|uniref:Ubiquitin-like protease family profile domain-containing protein n=2 Tax=Phytophthora nicotianae TaxID=4792 RepID=A0A0W8C331_PHYNI|nr:hypothetical protein AM587_10000343 [Phytophthora nicotianae]KUF88023.1 hypothetical protein AM587_10001952 [Phytophthora nicotianae]